MAMALLSYLQNAKDLSKKQLKKVCEVAFQCLAGLSCQQCGQLLWQYAAWDGRRQSLRPLSLSITPTVVILTNQKLWRLICKQVVVF